MRCFIALEVPDAVRGRLEEAVAPLRGTHRELRFSAPSTWHVTLAFLGEVAVDADDIVDVCEPAMAAEETTAIALSLGSAGHFRRSVLWVGVDDDPAGAVGELGGRLQRALAEAGLPVDAKPVRPHLTLARPRNRRQKIAPGIVDEIPAVAATWTATDVVLYRSHLGDGPARHEPLARIPLGGS